MHNGNPSAAVIIGVLLCACICLYPPYVCEGGSSNNECSISQGRYCAFTYRSNENGISNDVLPEAYQVKTDLLVEELLLTVISFAGVAVALHLRNKSSS
jgi:hypothetical protein